MTDAMSREESLALVRRLLESARRRDLDRLAECYADDAVAMSPAFGEVRGRAAIVATWGRMFSSSGNVMVEISTMLVDGNRVAVLGALTTTDLPDWFGQSAIGVPIMYRIVLLFGLAGGKVVSEQRIYDSAGVLERIEKARVDRELRTAAEVQHALLSRTARVGSFYLAFGRSLPCRAIGGDFFEFIELPTGDVGIVMGDVAGKGPPAALLAAMLQGMLEADPYAGGPHLTLERINHRLIARDLGARFATMVYAVLSPSGRLAYSNAGHNPPALATRDGIQRLVTGGPILGMFADASFAQQTIQLHSGDTLVMFTDGVTEARNTNDEEFGEERLLASVVADVDASPRLVLDRVFGAVGSFCQQAEQTDDITATVTRFA